METLVRAENIKKRYDAVEALKGISFDLRRGEILTLLGRNGAGKTTAMRILTGITGFDSGELRYDLGRGVSDFRESIGYLPERNPLYKDMKVHEYVTFMYRLRRRKGAKERVDVALERCGLTHVAHRFVGELSKGYAQRVGLAQAISHEPEVLFLDEATGGLDPLQILEIRRLIRELKKDCTILLSTHLMQEAASLSDRIAILDYGELKCVGTAEEIAGMFGIRMTTRMRFAGEPDNLTFWVKERDEKAEIIRGERRGYEIFWHSRADAAAIFSDAIKSFDNIVGCESGSAEIEALFARALGEEIA